jgi:hypothetical protein
MEENSKSGLYIVAIVGIIAVVGLIVLVMNAGSKSVAYPSESTQIDDSIGQAIATSKPISGQIYGCYEVRASSTGWGNAGVYQNNEAYINQVYVNCRSATDVVISGGFACNPKDWTQTQTVSASVSSPLTGTLKGWEVTCVGGESQAIAIAQCCKKS